MNAAAEPNGFEPRPLARFRAAVAEDLLTLATLHDRELDRERLLALWRDCYSDFLGLRLTGTRGREAMALLRRGLTEIPSAPKQETLDILAAEYADIYLNHTLGASPVESVWVDEDGLIMQEPMFQIREAYKAHGLAVPDWRRRSDDHLVHQLQFLSHLVDPAQPVTGLQHAATFMDEHLLRWIDRFAERVSERCATRFYAGLALLTAAYADELRDLLAGILEQPRPSAAEVEERMRPKHSISVPPPSYVPGSAPPGW